MAITRGFGLTMDLARGTMRRWVQGTDGVRRWADTDEPVADHIADANKMVGDPVGATHASPLPDDVVITAPHPPEK